LIALVDVLAVEPGFGGQRFQEVAIAEIERLIRFREQNDSHSYFVILVDGGITDDTTKVCNADFFGFMDFSFQSPRVVKKRYRTIEASFS